MRFVGSLEKIFSKLSQIFQPTQHLTFTSKERHLAERERERFISSHDRVAYSITS